MACNSLAVQQGEMSLDLATAIRNNQQAPEAARHLIAEALGVNVDTVRYYPSTQWAPELVWTTAKGTVRLYPDGRIDFQYPQFTLSEWDAAQLTPKLETVLRELGIACWQEESVQKLSTVARIKSDNWDDRTNVRTVTLTI